MSGKKTKGGMLRSRLMTLLLVLGLTCALGVLLGLVIPRLLSPGTGPLTIAPTATLLVQVQGLSQLVTVKYVMEKVALLEDVKWYGENRVLMVAHGVVKAGVNLADLKEKDLVVRGRTIVVRLPRAAITDAYLDEQKTRVVENTTGLLRTFDKDLQQTARRQAVDDIRRAARSSGILEDAEERAQLQMQSLFSTLGFESVKVEMVR